MSRNAQGMISDGNDMLLTQKLTGCEQKWVGNDQQQELDTADAKTYSLWAETHAGKRGLAVKMSSAFPAYLWVDQSTCGST